MLNYLEEKAYLEAHGNLHRAQMKANYRFQTDEARVEAAEISEEERYNYLDIIIHNYDMDLKQAEAEYDHSMDRIRSWKKLRRER